jgi:sugar lactone lactonase YvrE
MTQLDPDSTPRAFRMRRLATVAVAACTLLAATAVPSQPRWAELNGEAREAIDAGDYPKLRATLTELAPLMPGNVRIVYNTAAAAARLGDTPAALAGQHELCNMGLVFDLDADPDFDSLHGNADFDSARQCMERNKEPVTHARLWGVLAQSDLLPEDIACDPTTDAVFISSIRTNRIIDSRGRPFANTDLPVLALAVDNKRRTLWATVGWLPQCESCAPGDDGKTALLAFDIDSGRMTRRIESPVPGLFGDMTISGAGDVYVAEGQQGALFHLAPGATELERLDAPGELASPQQPALSADEKTLYVADYLRGIAAVDLEMHTLSWLQPAPGIALSGIDGLKVYGDSFIAVQNGTRPPRIVRLSLDLTRQQVLEANWPGLGEPAHGTLTGNRYLFVANTGWPEYAENGAKRPGSAPVTSSIYEIALEPPSPHP